MWIANKEGFSKPSQWNAFVFLLPLEHSCIVRTLWGCLVHSPYLTSAFDIHCGHQLLHSRLLVFTWREQMFLLVPLGAPALQAAAPVPRHWKSRRGARREVHSGCFIPNVGVAQLPWAPWSCTLHWVGTYLNPQALAVSGLPPRLPTPNPGILSKFWAVLWPPSSASCFNSHEPVTKISY